MITVFSVILSMFRSFIGGTLTCAGSISAGCAVAVIAVIAVVAVVAVVAESLGGSEV